MNVLGQEGSRRGGEAVDSADTPSSSGSAEGVGIASEPYFQPRALLLGALDFQLTIIHEFRSSSKPFDPEELPRDESGRDQVVR